MSFRRGFSFIELLAVVVSLAIAGAILIGMAPEPRGPLPQTFNNLRIIGQATAAYREDFQSFFPMTLTYSRGGAPRPGVTMEGWCNWSFGGKNNNAYHASRVFDVEAADRPLNPYVIPDEFFYAPPIPSRLPASHPARTQAAAPMFQDPGDYATLQGAWPVPTPSITGYDDVGTSYLFNVAWWEQIPGGLPFTQRFNEGCRRFATGEGVDPSRFVWLTDQYGDAMASHPSPRFVIANGYGDKNQAPLLFVDGHVTYTRIFPTRRVQPGHTFLFEP